MPRIINFKQHPLAFMLNKRELNFAETRIFLGLTKKDLRILTKNRLVPFLNRYRKPRIFIKADLISWAERICSNPENEIEKVAARKIIRFYRIKQDSVS